MPSKLSILEIRVNNIVMCSYLILFQLAKQLSISINQVESGRQSQFLQVPGQDDSNSLFRLGIDSCSSSRGSSRRSSFAEVSNSRASSRASSRTSSRASSRASNKESDGKKKKTIKDKGKSTPKVLSRPSSARKPKSRPVSAKSSGKSPSASRRNSPCPSEKDGLANQSSKQKLSRSLSKDSRGSVISPCSSRRSSPTGSSRSVSPALSCRSDVSDASQLGLSQSQSSNKFRVGKKV